MTHRPLAAVATVALVLVLAIGAACSDGDGDDGALRAQTTEPTAAEAPDTGDADTGATDTGGTGAGDTAGGGETNLDTTQSDTESDLSRQVSETLTDLGADVVEGDTVITLPEEVLFDFDRSELRPDATATLDRIAQAVVFFADAPVQVSGHTDSRGSDAYNQQLSEARAQAVVDHLVGAGADAGRITAQGLGEARPVAPNENADGSDNPEGRARNRRVEIVIEGVDPADIGS